MDLEELERLDRRERELLVRQLDDAVLEDLWWRGQVRHYGQGGWAPIWELSDERCRRGLVQEQDGELTPSRPSDRLRAALTPVLVVNRT
jgi:hypothetical protein